MARALPRDAAAAPADCQDLSTVLKGDTPVDVLSMDVMYAPYIVGMAESWAQVCPGSGSGFVRGLCSFTCIPFWWRMYKPPKLKTGTVVKIFVGGGGGGEETPNFFGVGRRKGLLRPGLCKSPLFACSVPAACHTRCRG